MKKTIDKISLLLLLGVTLALMLAACSGSTSMPTTPVPTTGPTDESGMAYPSPDVLPTVAAYPSPAGDETISEFAIRIDKPLIAGADEITGSGPAGLPIGLLDVTLMGQVLGETVIREDGTFSFSVAPLEAGHRVGIILGNLDGTRWDMEVLQGDEYFGDEARNIPLVGFCYDTAMVR